MYNLVRFAQLVNENDLDVPRVEANESTLETVLQITFGFAAIISVLIITIAGLSYVISGGNPEQVNRAKDAILYAVIGLVISLLAFTIVTFVIGRV